MAATAVKGKRLHCSRSCLCAPDCPSGESLQRAIQLSEKGQSYFSVIYMFHASQMEIRNCWKSGRHQAINLKEQS